MAKKKVEETAIEEVVEETPKKKRASKAVKETNAN